MTIDTQQVGQVIEARHVNLKVKKTRLILSVVTRNVPPTLLK